MVVFFCHLVVTSRTYLRQQRDLQKNKKGGTGEKKIYLHSASLALTQNVTDDQGAASL